MHLALTIVSGGARMERNHRCRRTMRIQLATRMPWDVFEQRAREHVDQFGVEVRATDEQKIDTDGMHRVVLALVGSARKQRPPQERIVVTQTIDLGTIDVQQ